MNTFRKTSILIDILFSILIIVYIITSKSIQNTSVFLLAIISIISIGTQFIYNFWIDYREKVNNVIEECLITFLTICSLITIIYFIIAYFQGKEKSILVILGLKGIVINEIILFRYTISKNKKQNA
jgi:hypothetical protein